MSAPREIQRVEAELRASRDQLRLALDAARMGIWDWDVAGGALSWSGQLEAIHGMRPGTFDGTFERFLSAIHPDDRARFTAEIEDALASGRSFATEFRAVGEDGAVRWVSGEGQVLFDDAGRPARMIGVGRDVTERRRVEEALRESEERFRVMADSAPVHIWVSDETGGCTWVNAEWLRYTGRTLDEETGDGWAEGVHPDDLARCRETRRAAAAGREAFEIEYRLRRADGSYGWLLDRGVPRVADDGAVGGLIGSCVDITERRAKERRDGLLAEIGVVLDGPLSLRERLDGLVRVLLPDVADACVVDLVDGDGGFERVAAAHVDPRYADVLAVLPPPLPDSPVAEVAASGPGRLVSAIPDALNERLSRTAADARARARLRTRAAVLAPLVARGRRLGVMTLSTGRDHSDRELTVDDLRLTEEIAERAALAIDNARLFESEHAARRQLQFLSEASVLLTSSLEYEETLQALARLVVPDLADWCTVHLLTDSGGLARVALAHVDAGQVEWATDLSDRYPPDPDAPTGLAAVIRDARAVLVEELSDEELVAAARDPEHLALLRQVGLTSYLSVPLAVRGRAIGALTLLASRESGRRFGAADLRLAQEVADRAASAIDNARLYRTQHEIADTLQRALLPAELPEVPGALLGAAYLPMGRGVEAGGDFYDVVRSEDDRWLVVIGDVCGNGPEAASLTALARYTLRALAQRDPDPPRLLSRLNEAVLHQRPGNTRFLTACIGLLEREDGGLRVTLAAAGHPPPLILRADGSVESVEVAGPLVGIRDGIAPEPRDVVLRPGDRLVLYTDGLTEARLGRGRLLGGEGLSATVAGLASSPAERLAHDLTARVRDMCGGHVDDDVAALVVAASGVPDGHTG